MRLGLFVPVFLSGCGTMFSGFNEYCEEQADCLDANEEDVKACVADIQNTRRISRIYGCEDDYKDYIECMQEEADCESQGEYDYWTDEGECNDDLEDYLDCLSDESNVIGGSSSDSSGDSDTVWVPSDQDQDHDHDHDDGDVDFDGGGTSTGNSCWFSDVFCIENTDPDPEGWCSREGGSFYDDDCATGWDGMCDIPSYTSYVYEYAATAYYYGMDGSTPCTDVGGTYTAG